MDNLDIVLDSMMRLAVALSIGLLIGLDRERAELRKPYSEFAGVRTFPLIAIAGCVPLLVQGPAGTALLAMGFLAVGAIVVIFYLFQTRHGHVGATTEMAALATFALGALAGAGNLLVAGVAGIAISVLLAAKHNLERFSRTLTTGELRAILELAVATVVVLPLLPDQGYGPWQALNPHEIWLVVVLVCGLSFAGFIATRLLGDNRGLAVTGAVGGIVSSTAVTIAMAESSRQKTAPVDGAIAGAILASTVMPIRIGVLAGVTNVGIVPRLCPVLVAMTVVGLIMAGTLGRRGFKAGTSASTIKNPLSIFAAICFGLVYSLVVLAIRATQEYLGAGGTLAAGAISGLADVDAATIAFARQGPGDSQWRVPAAGVATAVVINSLVKLGLGMARGNPDFRLKLAWSLGSMTLAGLVAGVLTYLLVK